MGDAGGSRYRINAWVEDKTQRKIQNLIPDGFITALTRLILVNAIYFKGTHQSPLTHHILTTHSPKTLHTVTNYSPHSPHTTH